MIKRLDNPVEVIIIRHRSEIGHALGTAKIAQLSLAQCRLFDVDAVLGSAELEAILRKDHTYLVYPGADALVLNPSVAASIKPKCIVILDGTWRKTKRLYLGCERLQQLPKLCLTGYQSQYRIRQAKVDGALSTIEAIAHSLSCFDARTDYAPLLKSFDWMVSRQIARMGQSTFQSNYQKR